MLLCCQHKHCFMDAVFTPVLPYCLPVCKCGFVQVDLALTVHRDELNLSKFACVCVSWCVCVSCLGIC